MDQQNPSDWGTGSTGSMGGSTTGSGTGSTFGTPGSDLGSGTGILAIAAARLGAGSVVAVDIDERATASCAANIRLNGVANRVVPVRGGGLEPVLGRLGITDDMVNNLKGQFQNVDIDEYLNTAREYLKDGSSKASEYSKENPGKVAAGVAALAL